MEEPLIWSAFGSRTQVRFWLIFKSAFTILLSAAFHESTGRLIHCRISAASALDCW